MSDEGDLSHVRVNVFPGGFNWGLYIGIDKGFFARHGLAVTVEGTPNSVAQMTDLSRGGCEIVMTAVDNIVAHVEGQGEAPIGAPPDFFAFSACACGAFRERVTSFNSELRSRLASNSHIVTAYGVHFSPPMGHNATF